MILLGASVFEYVKHLVSKDLEIRILNCKKSIFPKLLPI